MNIIKNYKIFTEGLLNKLEGPTYEEVKQNFKEGKVINIIDFYYIAKRHGDGEYVLEEIKKRLLLGDHIINLNVYFSFCDNFGMKPDYDLLKDMLFSGKISFIRYVGYLNKYDEKQLTHEELEKYFNSDNENVKNSLNSSINTLIDYFIDFKIKEGINFIYNNGGFLIYNIFKKRINRLSRTTDGNNVKYKNRTQIYLQYNIKNSEIKIDTLFIDEIFKTIEQNNINEMSKKIMRYHYPKIITYLFEKELNTHFKKIY